MASTNDDDRYSEDSDQSDYSDSISDPSSPKPTGGKGVAMLSLLSFYGIQDGVSAEDVARNPEAFIDLPQFDSNAYVKKLLVEAPMEELLAKDTQIVQEIRTLDSDMQMLVYENYNKFISATETIKRMKINVEVMDDDMAEVKKKMEVLCNVSVSLDQSLYHQRMKVDKIMRIKRLLNRLEFLTELPERLQELITKEMYHKAVSLYNKTINVLTKHSGVLSLKNIKERTELMMIELRGKVTNLLDDTSLETTKLTQYVTVLRMMQAPKPQVVQKLIAAHVSRAKSLIKSFQAAESSETQGASDKDSHSSINAGLTVSRTRKFHHLLIAGLIEACKGIHELFCNSEHLLTDAPYSHDEHASVSAIEATNQINVEQDVKDHEHAHQLLSSAIEDVIVSHYGNIMLSQLKSFFHEYRVKNDEVRQLEQKIKALSDSTTGENIDRSIINETSREPTEKEVFDRNLRLLQLHLYHLEEESQNWLLLARQSIKDLVVLETNMQESSSAFNSSRLKRVSEGHDMEISQGKESKGSFAKSFANDMLTVIGQHVDYLFWRRMLGFIPTFHSVAQALMKLTDIDVSSTSTVGYHDISASTSRSDIHSLDATSSHGGDPLGIRSELQKRSAESKNLYDKLFDHIISIFSDIIGDLKPVIEVYSTILPSKSSKSHHSPTNSGNIHIIPNTITGFLYKSSTNTKGNAAEVLLRNIHSNILGVNLTGFLSNTSNSHDYVAHIVWSFCTALSQLMEIHSNVSFNNRVFSSTLGSFVCENDEGIYTSEVIGNITLYKGGIIGESSHTTTTVGLQGIESLFQEFLGSIDTLNSSVSSSLPPRIKIMNVRSYYTFLASTMMKRISPTILRRIDAELKLQEGITLTLPRDSILKAKCAARLELSAHELLRSFVESNCESARNFVILTTTDLIKCVRFASPSVTRIDELVLEDRTGGHISSHLFHLCQWMHFLCMSCCVHLGEAPPQLKGSTYTASSTAQTSGQRRGGRATMIPGANTNNVHMDIERLFSQKIKIYNYNSFPGSKSSTNAESPNPNGETTSTTNELIASLDIIVGTLAKVAVKTFQEHVRFLTIPHLLYLELQIHTSVLKQISTYVLRDSTEVDGLIDQLNSAMFSRYTDANNISHYITGTAGKSGGESNDGAVVAKLVTQSIQELSKVANLIPKHA